MSMSEHQQDIDTVIYFLQEEMDVDVILGNDEPNAFWKGDTSGVSINTKQSKRLQLYSILHEAGHAIIRSNERYQDFFPFGENRKSKSISRRVDVIREEVMAWEEGRELALALGIELDLKLWHNFVKKNLFDYVKWAYNPDEFYKVTV